MKLPIIAAAALGVSLLCISVTAHADGISTATLTAGATLSVSGGVPSGFAASLNGADQLVYGSLTPLIVTDNRGTGVGWRVSGSATSFTVAGHTFAADSLKLNGEAATCDGASTCTVPTTLASSSSTLDHASAVTLASAAIGEGQGVIDLTSPQINAGAQAGKNLTLAIPGNAFAGAYLSTLTITVATAP
jgi:hypothetical protein